MWYQHYFVYKRDCDFVLTQDRKLPFPNEFVCPCPPYKERLECGSVNRLSASVTIGRGKSIHIIYIKRECSQFMLRSFAPSFKIIQQIQIGPCVWIVPVERAAQVQHYPTLYYVCISRFSIDIMSVGRFPIKISVLKSIYVGWPL